MDEHLEDNVENNTSKLKEIENELSSNVKIFEGMDNNPTSITEGLERNING